MHRSEIGISLPTITLTLREHEMDQITALADPAKNLVRPLGIVGIEIDKKIAAMLPSCALRTALWWQPARPTAVRRCRSKQAT
jgi:hypothetical protein